MLTICRGWYQMEWTNKFHIHIRYKVGDEGISLCEVRRNIEWLFCILWNLQLFWPLVGRSGSKKSHIHIRPLVEWNIEVYLIKENH